MAMLSLTEGIRAFQRKGYKENFVPKFDHLSARSEEIVLMPADIVIDEVVRFEDNSDPDNQSILYAISDRVSGLKGLYVDSFGTYHDDLSRDLSLKLRNHVKK